MLAFFCSIRSVLREANRAVELEGDDTYYAPAAEEVLAIVEAQTGETASAIARLPKLLNAHYFSWLSFAPLTPALLRIDPVWDPLRDDPLFQKLINKRIREFARLLREMRGRLGATELIL